MSHFVTVYSCWEHAKEYAFKSLDEAYEFAAEMKEQQYLCVINEPEEDYEH